MVLPRKVVYEKFRVPHIVKSYSRIPDVIPLPALVQIQVDSYKIFIEEGLRELLAEISLIQDFTINRHDMRFSYYRLVETKYSQEECRERDATYAAPLRVNVQLLVKETGEIKEQEIFMGDFPLMTAMGTFIINGAERVVVSQLVRSPGVYLTLERDQTSGRDLCYAKLIPNRGAWLEFETSNRDVVAVKVDRKRKIPITTLLRAIDEPELLPKHPSAAEIREIEAKIANAKTEREADKLRHQLLQVLGTSDRVLALFADIDNNPDHAFIKSTLDRDPSSENKEQALLEFYRRLRPGDPPTIDNARGLISSLFFNPRRYDLGKVGRYKVNKRLGRPNATQERVLTPDDLIAIVREIVRLNNGGGKSDDIDHLGNRRVRTVGELIQNQFRIGLLRMERVIRERMTITDPQETAPSQLVNIRPVVAAIKEFFGGSQLSQFMDQTNPLAELTHKRRLSALGPGGLSRDRAGFDLRDVHFSHYGRICPIETPEGPNIGLISSMSTFARINEFGFIETPYRKVEKGRVSDQVDYLTGDREENFLVAQANAPMDAKGHFTGEKVSVRYRGDFLEVEPSKVHYMDVSPKQLVSVAAGLIPFLEHDDANRALMGSNMQRQGVPLIVSEAPRVGTGLEAKVARDSHAVLIATESGKVASVTADQIVVTKDGHMPEGRKKLKTDLEAGVHVYELRKFMRSNAGTCVNQKPIVKRGQHVKRGQIIADGPNTDHGELALGRNVLVAFMPWNGYNFEDAIMISEKVVKEDIYTSIHIDEFEIGARDTKLGPEEITRDIPNVSEEALRNLGPDGVVRVGAEVKPGDILVGKITPKSETELAPEERLLRAIFGEKAA